LNIGSTETVDAKQQLPLKQVGHKAEFAKDVAAMANNPATSYLIIGLKDNTFEPCGSLKHHHTQNDLNQILSDKVDPPVTVGYQEFIIDQNEYAVVEIDGCNPPYIIARDVVHQKPDTKRVRIYRGMIFVRHEDRTEGAGRSELEDLLDMHLRNHFQGTTRKALHLALDKPEFWEYLLTAELLRSESDRLAREFDDLDRGLAFRRTRYVDGNQFIAWARPRLQDLVNLVGFLMVAVTEEIPASWGPPGEPGDPLEIKRAVDKTIYACEELLEWQSEIRSLYPPEPFVPLKGMMSDWAFPLFEQIAAIPDALVEPLEDPDAKGTYTVQVVFEAPANIDEVHAELDRLANHPEVWIDE
jgi:hypothetical protein